MKSSTILKGTLILTSAGIINRLLGFYYRIYLTNIIGAEGLGLYQMVLPAMTVCMAISCSGISLAISRYTALYTARQDFENASHTLFTGICIASCLSVICSGVLYCGAGFLARELFKDLRCLALIRFIALTLPLAAIHNCINSFYIGKCNTVIPALSQFFEQIIRVGSVLLICTIKISQNKTITATTGMAGLFCGELASCLFSVTAYNIMRKKNSDRKNIAGRKTHMTVDIIRMALPVTTNRIALSLLHGMEALLIPMMLKLSGLSNSESLSIYGILSGMAIPLVMLPSTLINSFSSMLLPTVSKNSGDGNSASLLHTIETALKCSLFMGIFCLGAFLLWGDVAAIILFSEPLAGKFVSTFAWMCPFLYIGTTFSSILNGLGKTNITLVFDVSSFIIRIFLIVLLVPKYGITGYLVGFLISEMYLALALLYNLYKSYQYTFNAFELIVKPTLALALSAGASLYVHQIILSLIPEILPILALIGAGGIMAGIYGIFLIIYFK